MPPITSTHVQQLATLAGAPDMRQPARPLYQACKKPYRWRLLEGEVNETVSLNPIWLAPIRRPKVASYMWCLASLAKLWFFANLDMWPLWRKGLADLQHVLNIGCCFQTISTPSPLVSAEVFVWIVRAKTHMLKECLKFFMLYIHCPSWSQSHLPKKSTVSL